MEVDPVVKYAIEQGLRIGIEAFEKKREQFYNDPRIVIVKSDAEQLVGGRMVLKNLEKRGFVAPYQFGIETVVDKNGDTITKPKGYIYYKQCEIVQAIENGNILQCLRKQR